ncbi:MAG: hypothetical protein ACRC2S_03100 [Waterburya sp.]
MIKNQLRFDFEPKTYPYPNDNCASSVKWGHLRIAIISANRHTILLETEWDLSVLIEWLQQNEQLIKYEPLVNEKVNLSVMNSESLAQAISRLQDKDFSDEEEMEQDIWFDTLFNFREHHSLSFALRGSRVSEIIIGCNNEIGEISLSNEISEWSYKFDIDDFFSDFHEKAFKFFSRAIADL